MCNVLAAYHLKSGHFEGVIKWAKVILKENPCDEAAHFQLMQVYISRGQRNEVLRQYQRLKRILADELGVAPLPETTQLLHTALRARS